jgi:23S rRNA (uridine2552-2'-O)-methyltransferase
MQEKHDLFRKGDKIVDLGCWPGGWLQVAAAAVGSGGRVVGVDRSEIEPALENANVVAFVADLTDPATAEQILDLMQGQADVLLSDAAPKLTGLRDRDRAMEEELLMAVSELVGRLLRPGGSLLLKILQGPEAQQIERELRRRFATARQVKVSATRKGSSERYLLARGFKG